MNNKVYTFGYLGSGVNHLRLLILLSDSYIIHEHALITIKDKMHFIVDKIYNNDRNCQKWLLVEGKLRADLVDHEVSFLHNDLDDYSNFINNKVIFLDRKPIDCLKHYYKFNSNLNKVYRHHFLYSVEINSNNIKTQLPNCLVLPAYFLDNEILEESIIISIENYLNINISREAAKVVHKLWFIKNKQAEEEFLSTVKDLYDKKILKLRKHT
jgi:hypothetical protein